MKFCEGRQHVNAETMSQLGHSPTLYATNTRLCKFVLCVECQPHRSKEQLVKLQVFQAGLQKFFMRTVQTRSWTQTMP